MGARERENPAAGGGESINTDNNKKSCLTSNNIRLKVKSTVNVPRALFAGEKRLVQSCVTGGQNPRFTQSVSHRWFENRGFLVRSRNPAKRPLFGIWTPFRGDPMRAAVKNVRLRIQNRPPFLPNKIEIPQFLLIYDSSLCFFVFYFSKINWYIFWLWHNIV